MPNIRIKLGEIIEQNEGKITKNALAREAKVRPNLIYDLCDDKTKRIDLETLAVIIVTLNELTGKNYGVGDILEYQKE
ncbi:helix-turn-helix transcriptional regulator [Paenibacillus antri]|uniref:Helix-turn-helix transcriptional regulator n=1 Tax=Paenibacillus antri TaxID=2582848 RepID=A0A5R9GGT0_9BACL|nr:helix-turn-helix transcriptional regulator [Paenibacillus antri]TLS53380.1 helix-turn-helix transcriptional regulator [Paenibacillus antri]